MLVRFAASALRAAPVAAVPAASRSVVPKAFAHVLIAPQFHDPRVKYDNHGVPAAVTRQLSPYEADWDFWTTSDAFKSWKPPVSLVTFVQNGEVYVLEDGSVYTSGWHVISPFSKLAAVKSAFPITMGILNRATPSKDGSPFDVYVVAHVEIVDFAKSALYKDPETLARDSERALSKLIRRTIIDTFATVSAKSGKVDAAGIKTLKDKIEDAVMKSQNEFGLKLNGLEFRGVFPVEYELPSKLRAMEPPLRKPDQVGMGLKADFWSEVFEPHYFFKYSYGTNKIHRTPFTEHLDFAVPSPPDYHHFNQVPRLCVGPDQK